MRTVFYRSRTGRVPVREYVDSLPVRDQAAVADVLGAIEEHGLAAPGVRFRVIRAKLWEFYIEGGASHRVFYVVVRGPTMVLLHAYKKQSRKAPRSEIDIAERRMKEVLHGN